MPTPKKYADQDKGRFNIVHRTKEETAKAAAKLKAEREARIMALRNASPSAKSFTSRKIGTPSPAKPASKSRAMTMEEMMITPDHIRKMMQKPAARRSPRLAQPRPPVASLGARSTLAKKLKY
jgi:hypothetical protein